MIDVFSPVTGEVAVNSSTAGGQEQPFLIAGDGVFGVFWEGDVAASSPFDPPIHRIFGRAFEADGTAIDAEDAEVGGTRGDGRFRTDVISTIDPDGLTIVLFDEFEPLPGGGFTQNVIGVRFSPDRETVNEFVFPAVGEEFDFEDSSVTPWLDGGFVVATEARTPARDGIALAFLDGDGEVIQFDVFSDGDAAFEDHEVLRLSNGNLLSLFRAGSDRSYSDAVLSYSVLLPDGEAVIEAAVVEAAGGFGAPDAPRVAATEGGGFVVGWEEEGAADPDVARAFVQSFDAQGAPHGALIRLGADQSADINEPSLVGMPDGGFVAAWDENANGRTDVYLQRFDSLGQALALPEVVGEAPADFRAKPRIAVQEDGRLGVAYEGIDAGGDAGVFLQIFAPRDLLTEGDDSLLASDAADAILGRGGDDTIQGRRGEDTLDGGAGRDFIEGMQGADLIFGGQGDDTVRGGAAADEVNGGAGNDRMAGGQGFDTLTGGAGDDTLRGDNGGDALAGDDGDDLLFGGRRDDQMGGGRGSDMLRGQQGDDTLDGGNSGDLLEGGPGRDSLIGWQGNDTLDGGTWRDTLRGDNGADVFVYRDGYDVDTIEDFVIGQDFAQLDPALWAGQVLADGDAVVMTFGQARGEDYVLDFGRDELVFQNVADPTGLGDSIVFG